MKPDYYIIVNFQRRGWLRIGNGKSYTSRAEAVDVAKRLRKKHPQTIIGVRVIKQTSALEFEC